MCMHNACMFHLTHHGKKLGCIKKCLYFNKDESYKYETVKITL